MYGEGCIHPPISENIDRCQVRSSLSSHIMGYLRLLLRLQINLYATIGSSMHIRIGDSETLFIDQDQRTVKAAGSNLILVERNI
jgi:hypothetical protein